MQHIEFVDSLSNTVDIAWITLNQLSSVRSSLIDVTPSLNYIAHGAFSFKCLCRGISALTYAYLRRQGLTTRHTTILANDSWPSWVIWQGHISFSCTGYGIEWIKIHKSNLFRCICQTGATAKWTNFSESVVQMYIEWFFLPDLHYVDDAFHYFGEV